MVDLTESIFFVPGYLRVLRTQLLFSFCFPFAIEFYFSFLVLSWLVLSVLTDAGLEKESSEYSFTLLCFASNNNERTEIKKKEMFQGQRLRDIPVHDSGGLGQGGRQHVLYRAQQAAVGARITTQQQRQQQQQQDQRNLAQPSVRGNIALVALIVPVLLVVIGAGIWWWWRRRRTRRFGKGGGGGDR